MTFATALIVVCLALAAIASMIAWPQLRQRLHGSTRLSPARYRILLKQLPWRPAIDSSQRRRLIRVAERLLAEVEIVGAGGQPVSDRQKLTIAGQVGLLSLGAQPLATELPGEIVIYAGDIDRSTELVGLHGIAEDLADLAIGADSTARRVTLSWPAVEAALGGGSHNPLIRALAHPRIFHDNDHDVPVAARSDSWAAALGEQQAALDSAPSSLIAVPVDTSTERFLALAAEAFFQRPVALHAEQPGLYELLAAYFDLDLAVQPPRFAAARGRPRRPRARHVSRR